MRDFQEIYFHISCEYLAIFRHLDAIRTGSRRAGAVHSGNRRFSGGLPPEGRRFEDFLNRFLTHSASINVPGFQASHG
jgi:hypothetical protein